MPDYIRVENVDSKPFQYHHNNVKKRIPPGKSATMPWDLACTLFGDPFSTNSEKRPDRTQNLARARGNFNYELGMETMASFDARRPKLEMYDVEGEQGRVYMLIDDPEGEHVGLFVNPEADAGDAVTVLTRQLNDMQRQLAVLIDQRTAEAPDMSVGQTSTVSVDGPGIVPQAAPGEAKKAEFIDGNAFAQRPEDELAEPLFDFASLATLGPDDVPPNFAPVDASGNSSILPAGHDVPLDAGVGSAGASDAADTPKGRGKLAPKPT